jgi:rhodanese-related sulfurtransferase
MHFVQYYLDCLSQASYVVGDEGTGRAVVVDPRRDVDVYLDDAAANGLRIERVVETHIHADFLSGHLELAAKTGAANVPRLTERMSELDPTRPTVVYCASGYRSSIGAGVLAAAGFDDVSDLLGGYEAWKVQHQGGREKESKA